MDAFELFDFLTPAEYRLTPLTIPERVILTVQGNAVVSCRLWWFAKAVLALSI